MFGLLLNYCTCFPRYDEYESAPNSIHLKFKNNTVKLTYEPFQLDFKVDQKVVTSFNSRGLMNFEHYREKERYIYIYSIIYT